jgi:uncharacterized protein (TIGR04551 family)
MQRSRRLGLLLACVATLTVAPQALAGEGDDALDKLLDKEADGRMFGGWGDRLTERPRSYPYVEHHGYFRFRADFFHNGHLGTVIPGDGNSGTSGIPAPLTENEYNNASDITTQVGTEDAKVISSANIRFRYQPTFHVSSALRIHATFDILDNLVMGSTPDFAGNSARYDVPLVAFAGAAAPPSSGVNGFSDSIRVKEAYGEWQPAFLLRVGRQASEWGLGILANGGRDVDSDFGDYTDRALLLFKLWGVYVSAAWDYVYSGAITDDPTQNFGQPKDLGGADDVNQYVLAFFQRPLSEKDKAERRAAVYERFEPAFDWGVYGVFRTQSFDLDNTAYGLWRKNGGVSTYDDLGLVPRDATAIIPDLWLRYEQRFDFSSGIKIELELAGILGSVDNVNFAAGASAPSSRDIQQFGGALEMQLNLDRLDIGLDAGFATGDDAEGFGILDRATLVNPDNSPNTKLTAFKFDRDYHTDLILFREVIGGVTNAVYIKPWIAYDLFEGPEDTLGFRLDLQYAQALEPLATPGNSSFLGFEADVRAYFYDTAAGFKLDVEMGFLLPGGAFNYRPVDNTNNRDASFAFTLQTRLTMQF